MHNNHIIVLAHKTPATLLAVGPHFWSTDCDEGEESGMCVVRDCFARIKTGQDDDEECVPVQAARVARALRNAGWADLALPG